MSPAGEAEKGLLDTPVAGPAAPATTVGGRLRPPKLLSSTTPTYPLEASRARVQGIVVIDALVDENGKVTEMKVLSGPAALTGAAMDSLRGWKYEPAQLGGQPIATHVKVNVNFNLK